ncbi:MAG: hypothetical protein HY703_13065 [Gemmatimonadetes bacterium]|nr:hypothetical protein [Gemmatimonadota bacterium]
MMKNTRVALVILALPLLYKPAFGQEQEIAELKKKNQELEERVKRLEEKQQLIEKMFGEKQEDPTHAETVFDEGFFFVGADDVLRIGSSAQLDVRIFAGGEGDNTFLVRRARVFATGVLEDKFGYMVMPRWDNGVATLHFAWLESSHSPYASLRIGQFKEPLSLEGLHSDQYWDFVERSLIVSTQLPLEDLGILLYGKFWRQRIEYGLGWFNGRGKNLTDNNDDKDVAARIVLTPWKHARARLLRNLNLGVSYSRGENEESLGGSRFRTGAGTTFWTFGAGTVQSDDRTRLGFDLEWIFGPASIKTEYLEQDWGGLARASVREDLTIDGWYVLGSYLLTGDEKRRNKPVVPKAKFDPAKGTWGAWEVAARYEEFRADQDVISSGIATGTNKVTGWSVGINWYPNRHMKAVLGFQHLEFEDALTTNGTSQDNEDVLTFRFQFIM